MTFCKIFIIITTSYFIGQVKAYERCIANFQSVINGCINLEKTSYKNGSVPEASTGGNNCKISNISVCQKIFNVSTIDIPPYSTLFIPYLFKNALSECCGSCFKYNIIESTDDGYNFSQMIDQSKNNYTHFAYPALAERTTNRAYGHYFIPLIDVPAVYYYTLKKAKDQSVKELISACWDLWPLLIVCLLFAFIAGCITWAMDTWENQDEFPRQFATGVFQGFWWSFISMTTVGYGDKSPKSTTARLFAIVWILIGITICSMFTASLTTAIMSAAIVSKPDMSGKTIGVLPSRLYDTSLIIRKGGLPDASAVDIKSLFLNLKSGKIEGFILDKYTAIHYGEFLGTGSKLQHFEQTFDGEQLSYGVLVTNPEDYYFVVDYIDDNRLLLEACISLKFIKESKRVQVEAVQVHVFSTNGGLFWPFFIISIIAIVLIICFGILYEYRRRMKAAKKIEIEEKSKEGHACSIMISDVNDLLTKWKVSSCKIDLDCEKV